MAFCDLLISEAKMERFRFSECSSLKNTGESKKDTDINHYEHFDIGKVQENRLNSILSFYLTLNNF